MVGPLRTGCWDSLGHRHGTGMGQAWSRHRSGIDQASKKWDGERTVDVHDDTSLALSAIV